MFECVDVSITVGDVWSCITSEDEEIAAAAVEFTRSTMEGECPVCLLCEKVEWKDTNGQPPSFLVMILSSPEGEFGGFVWGVCDACAWSHADLESIANACNEKLGAEYPLHNTPPTVQ